MAITLAMSIKSRRFVFMGGVVLAPFMASLAQEVIDMIRLKYAHNRGKPLGLTPLPKMYGFAGAPVSLAATVLMAGIFINFMKTEYFPKDEAVQKRRLADEGEPSVFRHMVGIVAQPLEAMEFFRKAQIQGRVFNEWNQGGFVAFHQDPDPETGRPPCKLMMDGRAQAAYRVNYFEWWRDFRMYAESSYMTAKQITRELETHGVNAVLLDATKSPQMTTKLKDSDQWETVYPIYFTRSVRYPLMLRADDPRNQMVIQEVLQARAIWQKQQQQKIKK
ncbi:hypothetical protein ACFL02_08025 [Planctomycetota bacterium]